MITMAIHRLAGKPATDMPIRNSTRITSVGLAHDPHRLTQATASSLPLSGRRGLLSTRSKIPAIRSSVPPSKGECVTSSRSSR